MTLRAADSAKAARIIVRQQDVVAVSSSPVGTGGITCPSWVKAFQIPSL